MKKSHFLIAAGISLGAVGAIANAAPSPDIKSSFTEIVKCQGPGKDDITAYEFSFYMDFETFFNIPKMDGSIHFPATVLMTVDLGAQGQFHGIASAVQTELTRGSDSTLKLAPFYMPALRAPMKITIEIEANTSGKGKAKIGSDEIELQCKETLS